MLYVHDKTKALFEVTSAGKHKIKKVKLINIMLEESDERASTHFLETTNKMPAHFVLDGKSIIKYDYTTTNVFPIDTKWTAKAKSIVEHVQLDTFEEISGMIAITERPLTNIMFDNTQTPNHITLYSATHSAQAFYDLLNEPGNQTYFHYILDEETCYELVAPTTACYDDNHIRIAVLNRNSDFDVFDRTAKLIDQLMRTYQTIDNATRATTAHYGMTEIDFESIIKRLEVALHTGGTNDEMATSLIKDDANPGDHIISVKLLYTSDKDFQEKEKALIRFLAEYLFYFQMDTSSLWRSRDLYFTQDNTYYNAKNDFNALLESVGNTLEQLKAHYTQIEIVGTSLPDYDEDGDIISHPFSYDFRDIKQTHYFLTSDQKAINQDYDSISIGGNVEMRSKFEDGAGAFSETIQFTSHYYEPVYPDLTVPPRNSTMLYNKGLLSPRDILKEMQQPTKPVIGKVTNLFDPYPTDDKIAQLEMHAPIVTLEYENAGDVQENMFAYTNNRFGNTEKRLVRLENILATVLRYQSRLASRISINCQYYGGQSVTDKYASIRCLNNDLTTDAMVCTLDQCLNCSRYEPILGQFYEITGDSPGMAQIFDDVQASLMTKEEFASLNNIATYHEPPLKPTEDLTHLHIRRADDKSYDELLSQADHFVMNWTEVPYHEQSPHINAYNYNPYAIYSDKVERLDSDNIYEDGWQAQEQFLFNRPQYNLNTIGGGNFNPATSDVNGLNGLHTVEDYAFNENDKRLMILKACEEALSLAQEEKLLYARTAFIKEAYAKLSPMSLYMQIKNNQSVNGFESNQSLHYDALYFDTTTFASYLYRYCGITKDAFTPTSLQNYFGFNALPKTTTPIIEQLTNAYPGDLLLYTNHIAIYAGEDYQYELSSDKATPKHQQYRKTQIQNRTDFIGIYRHTSLSTPSIKNNEHIPITVSLDDYVALQVGKNVGRDSNGDGFVDSVRDADWLYDKDLLRNYIDPMKRLTPELKMQFASIENLKTPGIITEDTINDFLLRKGGSATKKIRGLKVDRFYNPVRDANGNLEWEEKYAFPRGDVWLAAAERSGLNPLFLMAHCAGETGWCCVSNWTNYSGDFMAQGSDDYLFNAYGIWCYDKENMPNNPALHRITARRKTEELKWFSLEKSIIEGAVWIAESYVGAENVAKYGRRDTAYFAKWHFGNLIAGQNPDSRPGTMQYATDISWPDQRARIIYDALKASPVGREEAVKHFTYYIPQFEA